MVRDGRQQMFWIAPLVFAVVVTAMFVAGFREDSDASAGKAAAVFH